MLLLYEVKKLPFPPPILEGLGWGVSHRPNLSLLHRLACLNTCFPGAGAALKIVKTLGYMSNYRR